MKIEDFEKSTIYIEIKSKEALANEKIKKVINLFSKKYRKIAYKYAYYLAYWGHSVNVIISKLKDIKEENIIC